MKSSRVLWVDERVKWSPIKRYQLLKYHYYKGQVFLICTSPAAHWLFEIIEAKDLTARYASCHLLGIAKDREAAMRQVSSLIDALYNTQTLTMEAITT